MIVVMEIAIGLALFGGFFTWWAAVASMAMCVIFTLSGMFAWDQLWFVFAGILMLGGAGRSFGMDYWSRADVQEVVERHEVRPQVALLRRRSDEVIESKRVQEP